MLRTRLFFPICLVSMILISTRGLSQPLPGDVFREYYWYNMYGDAGEALRVGGDLDYGGFNIKLLHNFDLDHATKAEVFIEKILCHDGTQGLSIQINDNNWIAIPEMDSIPYPQFVYQHHTYPVVEVPLANLKQGTGNVFRMKVSNIHSWDWRPWPQNLINGVHFRIYYDASIKPHPEGEIITPQSGSTIGKEAAIQAEAQSPNGGIQQVDFVGLYDDVNFEGDGIYYQWHYHFYHGQICHYIGSRRASPYRVTWNTSWIPDQARPIQIAARIRDDTGMITMTHPVTGLVLDREGKSVELCRPFNVPTKWVTRLGDKLELFNVGGDLRNAAAAQLVWSSFNPGQMNGIFINFEKVFDKEGPTYQYFGHRVTIDKMSVFKPGTNFLITGMTPLYDGETVHGMEVQWPGIMVLIQYKKSQPSSTGKSRGEYSLNIGCAMVENYPNPFNSTTTIRYTVGESSIVRCNIVSISGQIIKKLVDSFQEAGTREIIWDGTSDQGSTVGSGIYFCTLLAGDKRVTHKLVYMR